MITQAVNPDKHPGDVHHLSGMHCPREVVVAECAAKAAAKEISIQKVAQIENNARKKQTTNLQVNHLNNKLTIPRATRTQNTVDDQGEISLLNQ